MEVRKLLKSNLNLRRITKTQKPITNLKCSSVNICSDEKYYKYGDFI